MSSRSSERNAFFAYERGENGLQVAQGEGWEGLPLMCSKQPAEIVQERLKWRTAREGLGRLDNYDGSLESRQERRLRAQNRLDAEAPRSGWGAEERARRKAPCTGSPRQAAAGEWRRTLGSKLVFHEWCQGAELSGEREARARTARGKNSRLDLHRPSQHSMQIRGHQRGRHLGSRP